MAFPSIGDKNVIGLHHRYIAEMDFLPHASTGILPAKIEHILLRAKA
jgi:hypothetical protein